MVPRSYYGGAWSADSQWFFYTVHDEAYRPHEVWRHRVGTPVTDDVRVLEEPDERFDLNVRASRSGDVVLLLSESRDTGEVWAVDAHAPESAPRSVGGRRAGIVYRAEHVRGRRGRPPAAGHQRRRGRVPAGAVSRAARRPTRTTPPGPRCARRTRPSGWSAWTPSPGTW